MPNIRLPASRELGLPALELARQSAPLSRAGATASAAVDRGTCRAAPEMVLTGRQPSGLAPAPNATAPEAGAANVDGTATFLGVDDSWYLP